MEISEATQLIQSGVPITQSIWGDLGAGTGIFTQALQHILPEESTIYALDKSPMLLYRLPQVKGKELIVVDGDFTKKMDLPLLDGIILANALHYASNQEQTLDNILSYLKSNGVLILVEYEQEKPNPPWVPYPVSFKKFENLAKKLGLTPPVQLAQIPSSYSYTHIYAARLLK